MIAAVVQKLKSLSVFFPVFNEEANLDILLRQALQVLPSLARRFELLVINDGSQDQSAAVALRLAAKHPQIKLVNHPSNLGYGEALKSGIKHSQYEWIFWTDSDLQFDLIELSYFVSSAQTGNLVTIGYRKKRSEGFWRQLNANLFKLYIDLLFRLHVRDIDCAFKLIRADLLKNMKLNSGSAFTSAEILYRLKKRRVRFTEIGVTHHPRLYGQPTGAKLSVIVKACYEALITYLNIKLSSLKSKK